MTGVIKRIVYQRGFGFIGIEGYQDYFFHRSRCVVPFELLQPGDEVVFDVVEDPGRGKQVQAHDVRRAK